MILAGLLNNRELNKIELRKQGDFALAAPRDWVRSVAEAILIGNNLGVPLKPGYSQNECPWDKAASSGVGSW